MYLVLTNNWGQAHRGFLSPLLSFQSGSKSVNKRQRKNHLSLSKSSIWEFLSKFMCISHGVDKTWIGSDHGLDHGPDHGLDHGPDHIPLRVQINVLK